ncbi:MAG: outer membrane lipoprotein-sorting protein [Ignavibacteria bacterium GWB2_35_12]|nr:MAG: outer membrane lipoprotein-sorting protein [Ignavibacteria bacterium GWA2_35_8]OGU42472.1 MAG: outer membrane lipoprotein-sorting protein [Ignavibacteria bacterium GWB2_35_12]OGU89876.1 MAG: outer membrane lipoprotein-sorting protein [Ignavibacteria bacterium RIFOXYA2_FULL_35_10]OGV24252.1 MAG: outer membrane lipoprotein-sorting protein [Ignavibacteria bacterium RIFOXYC2_FULL_35_21]
MKKIILVLVISILFFSNAFSQKAVEIIKKAEDAIKGETSYGKFTMNIITPDYQRSMTMQSWWVGNEKSLIVILSPNKDKGNKTLKIKNELWSYLKNTETTMKLPASMMLQSWNGSDLTNDDLVRESNLAKDYISTILKEESIGGEMCWKIDMNPNLQAAVVWGHIYYWVRQKDYLPALIQYYSEKGELVRTMKFSDYQRMSGRFIPAKWIIESNKKKGHYTEFIYNEVKFDVVIPDKIFSFRELEK